MSAEAAALWAFLERINERPEVFSRFTTNALWSSPAISEMLLRFHLDGEVDVASRRSESIAASLAWIGRTFGPGPGTRVLDLGCGPGLYALELARGGASVTGVDISPRSIDHARDRAREAGVPVDYVVADYLDWEPEGRFDLILLIMCDYCAFSPAQRAQLLERVARWLEPGGAFLFDVYSLAAYETWDEQIAYGPGLMDGFWSAGPYHGFLNTFRYDEVAVVLERYTIVEPDRVTEHFDWFAHFDVAGLTAEVEAAGLVVDAVLGDVTGEPFDPSLLEFALVARLAGA